MRFNDPLDKILTSVPKAKILRFLCRTETEISGLRLARLLRMSPTTVHKTMEELVDEQVIVMKIVGNAHAFRLNGGHWLVDKILKPVFRAEDELLTGLKHSLALWITASSLKDSIMSAALFGSVCSGEEKPDSDIDIFLVVKNEGAVVKVEEFVAETGMDLRQKTGMLLAPYVLGLNDYKVKARDGLAVIRAVLNRHVHVWGKRLEDLL